MAEINTVDYLSDAIGRETTPFEQDPLFEKILTLLLTESSELQASLVEVSQYSGLETATGNALDLIGALVGQDRELPADAADLGLLTYFGFDGADDVDTFGDLTNSTLGATLVSQEQLEGGVTTLSDEAYRFFIRAKIIANTTAATPEDVIQTSAFLFDLTSISYNEFNASIYLGLGRKLNETGGGLGDGINERAVAYLYIPRPAGVTLYLSDYDPDDVFGFQGDNNSSGFGTLTDLTTGGKFASSFSSSGENDAVDTTKLYYLTINVPANTEFTLPFTGDNALVSWGDGDLETISTPTSHTYTEGGEYLIIIYYNMTSLVFDNSTSAQYIKSINIEDYDATDTDSIANMFVGCINMEPEDVVYSEGYTTSTAALAAQRWVMVGSNSASKLSK